MLHWCSLIVSFTSCISVPGSTLSLLSSNARRPSSSFLFSGAATAAPGTSKLVVVLWFSMPSPGTCGQTWWGYLRKYPAPWRTKRRSFSTATTTSGPLHPGRCFASGSGYYYTVSPSRKSWSTLPVVILIALLTLSLLSAN